MISVKTEPAIYQNALNQLRLVANECVYVDDLSRNLEPANELGMTTVLASNNPRVTIADVRRAIHETVER